MDGTTNQWKGRESNPLGQILGARTEFPRFQSVRCIANFQNVRHCWRGRHSGAFAHAADSNYQACANSVPFAYSRTRVRLTLPGCRPTVSAVRLKQKQHKDLKAMSQSQKSVDKGGIEPQRDFLANAAAAFPGLFDSWRFRQCGCWSFIRLSWRVLSGIRCN